MDYVSLILFKHSFEMYYTVCFLSKASFESAKVVHTRINVEATHARLNNGATRIDLVLQQTPN